MSVYIATSLDGFIADSSGGLDWLELPNPEQTDYGYAEFISGIDALLMGRKTFEQVLTFDTWPYDKPVFVLSRSLMGVPEALTEKAALVSGELTDILAELAQKGYTSLYVDGGKVVQSCLREDLVGELILSRIPVLLGGGVPLFGRLERRLRFTHQETKAFESGLVQSRYVRSS